VDLANIVSYGKSVAAENENDGRPTDDGGAEVLLGRDRRAARIRGDTADEYLGVRRGVRHVPSPLALRAR
jgi:hypothetical protein